LLPFLVVVVVRNDAAVAFVVIVVIVVGRLDLKFLLKLLSMSRPVTAIAFWPEERVLQLPGSVAREVIDIHQNIREIHKNPFINS